MSIAAASAVAARSPLAGVHLLARQAAGFDPSEIPPQCQTQCATISNALTSSTCTTQVSCLCSSSTNNGLYDCLECALSLDPDQSVLSEGQANYDSYVEACQQAGVTIEDKSLTIPSGASTVTQVSITDVANSATLTGGVSTTPSATGNAAAVTDSAVSQTGSAEDPLKTAARNGAGVGAGVSGAGIVGAAAAIMAALSL
ncbi:hypothetical protein PYCCODRAFT_1439628 [Trametes coccinea BRFM310]|uniref:Uncharacterized protein n=1 Tax=Trametes coccinea (strain BRFM310) TaxID=1353009 RepID=A0A1Y2IBQ7_TRAC3|nr:hypothetical protein PYCCODRAFT_1439628 [Trametes coccinea BRFM310]